MDSWMLDYMEKYDYENIFVCQDRASGLKAFIAIHDTTLGPAAGGCRMWTYDSEKQAIEDAFRLAKGMTYKYAAAGVNLGGGKCIVIGDPKTQKTEGMFRALGRFIQRLGGLYRTGEDVGVNLRDMEYIRMETTYVNTLPEELGGVGPISHSTAFGVVQGMKACMKEVRGIDTVKGLKIAVQGLGSVGYHVSEILANEGASLLVTDIDVEKVNLVVEKFGAIAVSPENIHKEEVDIYCPCALGAVINDLTIDELNCKIIAGSANNQLAEERHGDALHKRGILYAPDYIINAGGAIYDSERLNPGGFSYDGAMKKVGRIYETMENVLLIAKEKNVPTYLAADLLAEQRLEQVKRAKGIRVDNYLTFAE
jgi:leucine dehydrogenase